MIRNSLRGEPRHPSAYTRWHHRLRWQPSSTNLCQRLYATKIPGNVPNIPGMAGSMADQQRLAREALLKRFGQVQQPLRPQPAAAPPPRPPPPPPPPLRPQAHSAPPRQPRQQWNSPPATMHGKIRESPRGDLSARNPNSNRTQYLPRDGNAVRSFDTAYDKRTRSNEEFKSLDGSGMEQFAQEQRRGNGKFRPPDGPRWDQQDRRDGGGFRPPDGVNGASYPERRRMESFPENSQWGQLKRKPKDDSPASPAVSSQLAPTPSPNSSIWDILDRQAPAWKPKSQPPGTPSTRLKNSKAPRAVVKQPLDIPSDNFEHFQAQTDPPTHLPDIPSDSIEALTTKAKIDTSSRKGPDFWDEALHQATAMVSEKQEVREAERERRRVRAENEQLEREVEVDGIRIVFGDVGAPPPNVQQKKREPAYIDHNAQLEVKKGGKKKTKKSGTRRSSRYDDEEEDFYDEEAAAERRRRKEEKRLAKAAKAVPQINLPEYISVSNLADAIHVKKRDLLIQLVDWGFDNITDDSIMTGETAALVAQEYGFEPKVEVGQDLDLKARPAPEDPSVLPERPPVVTIMGHVDHGKTTLLDYLRKSSVALQEHGGITQHIGAFSVKLSTGKTITFLDTPGHAAFLTMRQRGANVTDIVVLVVAADDSVMPQTVEALKHARAAKVPIIVAINKVDKPQADIQRVKADLGRHGVELEEYGGDVQAVAVSGKTGKGMSDLEENILLLAEVLDLRGDPTGMAEGWVLESTVKGVGKAATVLVKRGTLRVGDIIVAGKTLAKVRALRNEAGKNVKEAGPGTPVEVLGWRDSPHAGDEVIQAPNEQRARAAIHYREDLDTRGEESTEAVRQVHVREERAKERAAEEAARLEAEESGEVETLEEKRRRERDEEEAAAQGTKLVNFVVRADVAGSVEAVAGCIQEVGNNEVQPRILRQLVGPPTISDVDHAATSGSTIVSFNNDIPGNVRSAATKAGVPIIDHSVIYHLQDAVKEVIQDKLPPRVVQKVLADAEVLQVFSINIIRRKFRNIAGSRITNGAVKVGGRVRVMRKGEKVYEGKIETLKHVKKDVTEMKKGQECGIGLAGFDDVQPGDLIQVFEEVTEKRYL